MSKTFGIIGAGLAGCEAAWQLAQAGHDVVLYEMKPQRFSPPIRARIWPSWSAPIPSARRSLKPALAS